MIPTHPADSQPPFLGPLPIDDVDRPPSVNGAILQLPPEIHEKHLHLLRRPTQRPRQKGHAQARRAVADVLQRPNT